MSVELSAGSHTGEPTLHIGSERVIHPADGPDLALPGLSLDEVRALLRGALVTDATDPEQPAALWSPPATLAPVPDAFTAPSKVLTIGDVLWLWRAAERLLEIIDVGSPEGEATVADISDLRAQYQRLFEARQREG